MKATTDSLQYGDNWRQMLIYLAQAECLVDVFLCSNAYGHSDDRDAMVGETHGVRVIYVGEDFFIWVHGDQSIPASFQWDGYR